MIRVVALSSACVMSHHTHYIISGGVAGMLTHAFALAIALPHLTMATGPLPHGGAPWDTHEHFCAGLHRAGWHIVSLRSVCGGGGGGGGALKHIGMHWNTTSSSKFASRLDPVAAPTVFRVRGEGPSSACVINQQKHYILWGGVVGIFTYAFALAIALPPPLLQ